MNPRAYVTGPTQGSGPMHGWWVVILDGCAVDRRRTLGEAADRVRRIFGDPVYLFDEGAWVLVADTSPGEGGTHG